MQTKILIIFVCIILSSQVIAQTPPDTLWTRTFGGIGIEAANDVLQTNDGGYIIAGRSNSLYYALVVKTNENGIEEWSNVYNCYNINSILQTDDGFVLVGTNFNLWSAKITEEGLIEWEHNYTNYGNCIAYCVQKTSDNGYIIAGTVNINYGFDFILMKTDAFGNEEWSQTYSIVDEMYWEQAFSVQQTIDNGFIIAGYIYRIGGETNDAWLVKTDSLGNEEWNHYYGGDSHESAESVLQTNEGGFIFAGWTGSYGAGERDFWLVKIDELGNEEWDQTYGGIGNDEATSFLQTSDGGYIIAGFSSSFCSGESDLWLVKTDDLGNEEWNQNYGGINVDSANAIRETSDENYIAAGRTYSFGAGESDFWLVRFVYPVGTDNAVVNSVINSLSNYPNPFNPETIIEYSIPQDSKVELKIYNIKGQKVKQLVGNQLSAGQHSVVWDGRDDNKQPVGSGIYLYKLKTGNFQRVRKMILMK